MMGARIVAGVLAVAAFLPVGRDRTLAFEQAAPAVRTSFAGEWRLLGAAPPEDAAGRAVLPTLTIAQSASALVITAPRDGALGPQITTYRLDGTLSVNVMDNGDQVRSKARWHEGALVSDGIGALGEEVVTIHETRRLDDGGATMVIETSAVTNLGGARTHTVVRYRRQ